MTKREQKRMTVKNPQTGLEEEVDVLTSADAVIFPDGKTLEEKWVPATTTTEGIVKLNDTVTSTSTTEAATANAARLAYEKAQAAVNASK